MTTEQIKLKLIQLHRQENEMNKLISGYDKQIKYAENKKRKLQK